MQDKSPVIVLLLILIATLLAYALSQIEDSFYEKIEEIISYKWLLIISLILIVSLTFTTLFYKIKSNNANHTSQKKLERKLESNNDINYYLAEYAGLNWIIEENDNNYTVNPKPLCPKHRFKS